MLFGVEPLDPATFALVTLVLAVTGAIAIAGPAWRATRIDPVAALRGTDEQLSAIGYQPSALYSLSACTGLSRVARREGSAVAASATSASTIATPTKMPGSRGVTP